jgi:hypothetical protein
MDGQAQRLLVRAVALAWAMLCLVQAAIYRWGTMRARFVAVAVLVTACGNGDAGPAVADLSAGQLVFAPTPAYAGACAFPETLTTITTEAEWQRVWSELFACASAAPALPAVDFSREMLAVAALGQRGSSGYSVAIRHAALGSDDALHVGVVEYQPGRRCAVATVITYPVAIARVPRTDAAVAFDSRVESLACD